MTDLDEEDLLRLSHIALAAWNNVAVEQLHEHPTIASRNYPSMQGWRRVVMAVRSAMLDEQNERGNA